jgi:hypothetical protein
VTRLLAACVLCTACAAGTIRTPDGTQLEGWAFGQAEVSACVAPILDVGPTLPVCWRVAGGSLSIGAGEVLSSALAGLVAWLTGGVVF